MKKNPKQLSLFPEENKDLKKLQTGFIYGYVSDHSVYINEKQLKPDRSLKLRKHSPDGFSWGYGGSGAAQLSLAILLQFYDKVDALRFYNRFKWNVIAELEQFKDFKISATLVHAKIAEYKYNTT